MTCVFQGVEVANPETGIYCEPQGPALLLHPRKACDPLLCVVHLRPIFTTCWVSVLSRIIPIKPHLRKNKTSKTVTFPLASFSQVALKKYWNPPLAQHTGWIFWESDCICTQFLHDLKVSSPRGTPLCLSATSILHTIFSQTEVKLHSLGRGRHEVVIRQSARSLCMARAINVIQRSSQVWTPSNCEDSRGSFNGEGP